MRALLVARAELICRQCGNLRSECSDPAIDWHPRTTVCWASASTQLALRYVNDKHGKTERSPNALHPTDGLSVFVSQVPPAEDEDEFADLA